MSWKQVLQSVNWFSSQSYTKKFLNKDRLFLPAGHVRDFNNKQRSSIPFTIYKNAIYIFTNSINIITLVYKEHKNMHDKYGTIIILQHWHRDFTDINSATKDCTDIKNNLMGNREMSQSTANSLKLQYCTHLRKKYLCWIRLSFRCFLNKSSDVMPHRNHFGNWLWPMLSWS